MPNNMPCQQTREHKATAERFVPLSQPAPFFLVLELHSFAEHVYFFFVDSSSKAWCLVETDEYTIFMMAAPNNRCLKPRGV
jgi:hypothetical protein